MAGLVECFTDIPLSAPTVPYLSNVTGAWITPHQATSPKYYSEQMRRPVQFLSSVRALLADRSLVLLEVGPSASLQTMARLAADQSRSRQILASFSNPSERRADDEAVLEAAGRLWLAGAPRIGAASMTARRRCASRCPPIRSNASGTGSTRDLRRPSRGLPPATASTTGFTRQPGRATSRSSAGGRGRRARGSSWRRRARRRLRCPTHSRRRARSRSQLKSATPSPWRRGSPSGFGVTIPKTSPPWRSSSRPAAARCAALFTSGAGRGTGCRALPIIARWWRSPNAFR